MPSNKPRVSGWYLDLDGKKSGPHNVEEIRELLMHKRILADQPVFSEADLPRPGEGPGWRPSGKLLHVGELLDQYTDPALSLLDALQAARGQKKASPPASVHNAVAEDRNSPNTTTVASANAHAARVARGAKNPDRKPDIPPQIAIFAATAMVAAAVVWGTIQLLKHSKAIMPPAQNSIVKNADGINTVPIGTETRTPVAPVVRPPVPTPGLSAAQPVVPVGGGFSSWLKSRSITRPLASVPTAGRPTPPEPSANRDSERDDRDAAEAKEREQHERDVRESQDTGGGGGQPIDSDPGQPTPAANNNESVSAPPPPAEAPPAPEPNTNN